MTNDTQTIADGIEAKATRKAKVRILPFILVLYVVAFLDRINIGFAALTMNGELGITPSQFGLLAGIFLISYAICEIPSNLLLHKFGARIWMTRILITWGVIATLTGLVQNVGQLYLARFLLGLAEAGYFPGILLYLSYWFRQRDQAQAIAFFIMGIPVTSIIGAPVSGLILDHIHWLGLSSWRWLLILEGIPAVICGFLAYYFLPSRPAEASYLTAEEKNAITAQLKQEEDSKRQIQPLSAARALIDPRVWHLASIAFVLAAALYIANFWMPQVVKSFSADYSNTMVGLLVLVPNLVGLLFMFVISRNSDRRQERRWHTAIPALVGGIACLCFGLQHSPFLSMVLLSLLALGMYGAAAPFWALPNEFLAGFSAASGIALIASIGTIGGFFGSFAVGLIRQKTGSLSGGIMLAGVALLVLALLVLLLPPRRTQPDR
jgi:MFS transporter, ACS family, tartrate transporter